MTDIHADFLRRISEIYANPVWMFDSGHQPPSVNTLLMFDRRQKRFVKSEKARQYNAHINFELRKVVPEKPFENVAIAYLIRFKDNIIRDLANYEKALTDALVANRIMSDDNHKILKSNQQIIDPNLPPGVRVRILIFQQTEGVKP